METATASSSSSPASISFYDFLDRMRNPASLDLVRSIKSFIVSFSFYAPNPESDGKRVQDFFLSMETSIRDHPLWAGASDEEIDCAMEGLEKYVMTKLFSRAFACCPDDLRIDQEIAEKISMLQTFLRPEHLDIPTILRNESSWLLAEKELGKINAHKAPREKLLCIMNCCRVINNLLLNASMSEKHVLAGADDFLPANPPQLHSNLKFIQLYRRQAKLTSEAAYYFTNLVSAKSFIVDLHAKSLSIDEIEFEENMQVAKLANKVPDEDPCPTRDGEDGLRRETGVGTFTAMNFKERSNSGLQYSFNNLFELAKMHMIVTGSPYPFMQAEARDLTVGDVERLLRLYKDVVDKYTNLCTAYRHLASSKLESGHFKGSTASCCYEQPETSVSRQREDGADI
ncbi:hypothetical protein CDL15_Pgr015132 [Punica granatum]|uniref:VPS9 domain-containing protein n=1 Tax=Punica granatum TaxID=22663 RepID=A0A218VZR7_PUNGR|nr:hypothetical protein CDL15_Pgr015132 [Punica granatum]